MSSIVEIEKLALDLSEQDRATLALNLLASLPPVLADDDGGVAEALRRDEELNNDPSQGVTLAELDSEIRKLRK